MIEAIIYLNLTLANYVLILEETYEGRLTLLLASSMRIAIKAVSMIIESRSIMKEGDPGLRNMNEISERVSRVKAIVT